MTEISKISKADRLCMKDHRYRARLMNSLSGPKSTSLIGSVSKEGQTNCAIFSSVIHLGADPALMGFVVRPDSVDRHTLSNIIDTGVYTINTVSYDFCDRAHQTSARYNKDESEFDHCSLEAEYLDDWVAPFVKESLVKWSMRFIRKVEIAENGTYLIIGEVENIYHPTQILDEDGHLHLALTHPSVVVGLDEYCAVEKPQRFSYAKKNLPLTLLPFKKDQL